MHVQVVSFHLNGMREAEYLKACEERFAPVFSDLPGLVSKLWLKNTQTNTYGGVYTGRDEQAMQEFQKSELFQAVATNPHFAELHSMDFANLERPTRTTRGLAETMVRGV